MGFIISRLDPLFIASIMTLVTKQILWCHYCDRATQKPKLHCSMYNNILSNSSKNTYQPTVEQLIRRGRQ